MTLSRAIVRAWRTHIEAPIPDAVLLAGRMHLLDVVGVGIAASALEQLLVHLGCSKTENSKRRQ